MNLPLDPLHVLQVICGLWFLPHVAGKLRNVGPASGTFEAAGLRPGRAFLFLTVGLELLACAGLVFDVLPRLAGALGVIVLLGATYAVLRINGPNWRWNKQGPEYMILWSIAIILAVW